MKLLFDQKISYKIVKDLQNCLSGSTTIKHEGLINSSDREIWEFAKKHKLTEYKVDIEVFISEGEHGCLEIINIRKK